MVTGGAVSGSRRHPCSSTEHRQTGSNPAMLFAIGDGPAQGDSLVVAINSGPAWRRLVREVAHVVQTMPLWKLQTVGRARLDSLYANTGSGNTITLHPGVASCLVDPHPLPRGRRLAGSYLLSRPFATKPSIPCVFRDCIRSESLVKQRGLSDRFGGPIQQTTFEDPQGSLTAFLKRLAHNALPGDDHHVEHVVEQPAARRSVLLKRVGIRAAGCSTTCST